MKTIVSTRDVPLDSALLAEGMLEYVKSVGDGPLFPQLRLDGYGRRAGQAATDLSGKILGVASLGDIDTLAVKVWVDKNMYGKKYKGTERSTFVIDEDGRIAAIFRKVKPDEHVDLLKQALSSKAKK